MNTAKRVLGMGFAHARQPATQSLYSFSNLGSRRWWEKPAVDSHFPSVAFSLQESFVNRGAIRVVEPQTTTLDHSSVGVTESMTRILASGRAITGDRDAIHRSNGEIAAFVHAFVVSLSSTRKNHLILERLCGFEPHPSRGYRAVPLGHFHRKLVWDRGAPSTSVQPATLVLEPVS